jgi:hypothetical protein
MPVRSTNVLLYHRSVRSTPLLTEARPLDGYVVHVRFKDGTAAAVNLSYLLA